MKRIIITYKGLDFKVNISHNNTCILDSYKIKDIDSMQDILYIIQDEVEDPNMAINKRGIWSMTNEWRAHNLLYSLGIEKDRTKSVDLDLNQPWYMKLAYTLLSCLYPHF